MASSFTPQHFVLKWRAVALSERSSYQQHFLDLCRLIDHPSPADIDPAGTFFTFEAGATKTKGGQGWADVWKKGAFAWEYKGKHANLDKAYQQLLQYRESLENPPLLVVSDTDSIIVHTNFTNTVKRVITITFDDLLTPAGLARLRAIFLDPEHFRAPQTAAQVTEEAAEEFSKLAASLRAWGEQPPTIAHFLIRLLFCLFAEDVRLLPGGVFSRLVEQTRTRPNVFAAQLRQLFQAMATGGFFGTEEIRHFNGKLFDNDAVLELDSDGLDILLRVSRLDWSSIEPAILGTLFERSLDPEKRSQLGAHYTSRDDILLIVEPVLMQPLRRRWEAVQAQARDLAARRDAATGGQRTRLQNELAALLMGFAGEIAGVRVLDPACGSGNFLYVALKQLLDMEKAVITLAGDLAAGTFFPTVSPEQLRGIEVNEYAHELAQITVWIGYIQWLRDNGFGTPSDPVLKPLDTIRRMDAILAFGDDQPPHEPAWPEADVVIGNPPFLGDKKMRAELGDSYVEAVRGLYAGRVPGGADLVTYWFERSRALIEQGRLRRAGLLATNSIRQRANRAVLERIKQTGDIFMAWPDRPWVLDGAAVRVSLVGFDDGTEMQRTVDGQPAAAITPDLTRSLDITAARRLVENARLAYVGDTKKGKFDLPGTMAAAMMKLPINPNGRPNSDVLRPYANAYDVTQGSRGVWIIDFGIDMSEEEAALYEAPFAYVREHVKPERDQVRNLAERTRWWLHARPAPDFRAAVKALPRYIVTPQVAKHRIFAWMDPKTLPAHKLIAIARADDYCFGILHSHIHELWSLRLGSWQGKGNDPVYTPTTCFETFPFPWPPGKEPQGDPRVTAIAAATARLVELRDRWLNPQDASEADLKKRTLTNLYNERPAWLDMAHRKLDQAVLDAYGWPHDLSDEAILARLLALNLERAAAQGAAPAAVVEDDEG